MYCGCYCALLTTVAAAVTTAAVTTVVVAAAAVSTLAVIATTVVGKPLGGTHLYEPPAYKDQTTRSRNVLYKRVPLYY